MTKAEATREAKRRFGKTASTRVYTCVGSAKIAGRQTTRGCMERGHLQPCPGGPLVYQISRITESTFLGPLTIIEMRGESWEDCFRTLDEQKEAARKLYAKPRKGRKAAK